MRDNLLRRGPRHTLVALTLAGALTTLGLAGCGSTTPAPAAPAAATLSVRDPWVKAAAAGEMTAAFGTLVNDTDAAITVTAAESPASPMELHEMSMKDGKMVMQPKQGGFTLEARGTHELGPGGDHLMLMKPVKAIEPGDALTFTLRTATGGTVTFTAIAKPFAGANESYDPGAGMPGMSFRPVPGRP